MDIDHSQIKELEYNEITNGIYIGTPSVLINGRLVVGAQPFQTFADIINQEAK